jgi:hypothetical protein
VKHFCPIAAQNLTWRETAASRRFVRLADFLVQLESGIGGASMLKAVAKSQFRCKIHSYQGWRQPPLAVVRHRDAAITDHFCT